MPLRATGAPSGGSVSGTWNSCASFATFDASTIFSSVSIPVLSWPNSNWSQSYFPAGAPDDPVPEELELPEELALPEELSLPDEVPLLELEELALVPSPPDEPVLPEEPPPVELPPLDD